jgi:hypothetical protein
MFSARFTNESPLYMPLLVPVLGVFIPEDDVPAEGARAEPELPSDGSAALGS